MLIKAAGDVCDLLYLSAGMPTYLEKSADGNQ